MGEHNRAQAHRPIHNNDDWLAACNELTSRLAAHYVTDQPLTMAEGRIINSIAGLIGVRPESGVKYLARLMLEDKARKENTVTVSAAIQNLPPGTVVDEG